MALIDQVLNAPNPFPHGLYWTGLKGSPVHPAVKEMLSTAYRELTVGDDGVFSLDVKYDPAFFELKIPIDYKGDALPLWQFSIQPNPDFKYERPKRGV